MGLLERLLFFGCIAGDWDTYTFVSFVVFCVPFSSWLQRLKYQGPPIRIHTEDHKDHSAAQPQPQTIKKKPRMNANWTDRFVSIGVHSWLENSSPNCANFNLCSTKITAQHSRNHRRSKKTANEHEFDGSIRVNWCPFVVRKFFAKLRELQPQ